jgi:hypothetical protein
MTSQKEFKKIVGRGSFIFRVFFFRIFGPFFAKIYKKTRFFTQKGPKNPKKCENEKSATNKFFGLLWASHSQETGHQGSNMEN